MCCCSRSSISARIASAASRNGTAWAARPSWSSGDTHPVQPVARQIDDRGTRGEGEHDMELAQGQFRISGVEQEKAELLATIRLVGAGAGVKSVLSITRLARIAGSHQARAGALRADIAGNAKDPASQPARHHGPPSAQH
jgi:hypothetical protein